MGARAPRRVWLRAGVCRCGSIHACSGERNHAVAYAVDAAVAMSLRNSEAIRRRGSRSNCGAFVVLSDVPKRYTAGNKEEVRERAQWEAI